MRTRLTMKNMDERVFEVLFKAISSVMEALEPFSPAAVDIHRMWHGSRGFFFMSPEGVQRRRDLTRQALRYGNWGANSPRTISRAVCATSLKFMRPRAWIERRGFSMSRRGVGRL